MIRCRKCEIYIGLHSNFGFLVIEADDPEECHFVAEKNFMTDFEEKGLHVNTDLVKGLYYVVNCQLCGIDLGKKFVKSTATYIALAKEKLLYDEVKLKENEFPVGFPRLC